MDNDQRLYQVCQKIVYWLNEPKPQDPGWSSETWHIFQQVSLVHGVTPYLHHKLTTTDWLNPAVNTWLADQYSANQQRIAKMQQEATAILACLNQHNVPIVPLKGVMLTALYYSNPALRPMNDLDFLIKPEDFQTCVDLLAQLNYQPHLIFWKNAEFIKATNKQVISTHCEHPENPRWVEIHRRCQEIFGGPVADLTALIWADTQQSHLLGQPVNMMSADLLWLHLAVHTNADIWRGKFRLIQLLDLVQLTPHVENLPVILDQVDARFTFLCLSLLERTFPNTIDAAVFARQQQRVSKTFRRWSDSFDWVNASYLNEQPHSAYLTKVLRFNEGRPREVSQALRLLLFPQSQDLRIDQTQLPNHDTAKMSFLLYARLWLKHISGIIGRRIFSIGNEVR